MSQSCFGLSNRVILGWVFCLFCFCVFVCLFVFSFCVLCLCLLVSCRLFYCACHGRIYVLVPWHFLAQCFVVLTFQQLADFFWSCHLSPLKLFIHELLWIQNERFPLSLSKFLSTFKSYFHNSKFHLHLYNCFPWRKDTWSHLMIIIIIPHQQGLPRVCTCVRMQACLCAMCVCVLDGIPWVDRF